MTSFDVNDSIAAIASPLTGALRGVIRLSGPGIRKSLEECFHGEYSLADVKGPSVIPGWIQVSDPIRRVTGELFYWPDEASYTRQRSAEFHCTGSLPVLEEVMKALGRVGVRQALPGEFTMRAFLAGRMDLTRAEAVLGVIDSETEREMEVALKQLAGGLSGPITQLQDGLLDVLSQIEAGLDFVEEDIEFISRADIRKSLELSHSTVREILDQMDQRQLDQHIPRVVLWGRPNAGKSFLQNALVGEGTAIVSEIAGTTRDYLVARTLCDGLEVCVVDTAGTMSMQAADITPIQELAEQQTESMASSADLVLLCVDGTKFPDAWEQSQIDKLQDFAIDILLVQTKLDQQAVWNDAAAHQVSSHSGRGIESLKVEIAKAIRRHRSAGSGEMVHSTAGRCFESLSQACEELSVAIQFCDAGQGDEIIAAVLRVVLDHLSAVTGKVFTDDILDRVFSRFCIGK